MKTMEVNQGFLLRGWRHFRAQRRNERGRTMLELVTVLGMVGLVSALAGEGFIGSAVRNESLVVQAEIASELRRARQAAMTRRQAIRVVFEPEGSGIRIEQADTPTSVLRHYNFSGKPVIVESLSNGPSVTFYPSGRAATPTTVTLRDSRGVLRKLTVSLTGRVNVK